MASSATSDGGLREIILSVPQQASSVRKLNIRCCSDPHGMLDCYSFLDLAAMCGRYGLSRIGTPSALKERLRTYARTKLAAPTMTMDLDPSDMSYDFNDHSMQRDPPNPLSLSTNAIRNVRQPPPSIEQLDLLTPSTLRSKASRIFRPPSPAEDPFIFGSLNPSINGDRGTRATLDAALQNVVLEMHARIASKDPSQHVPQAKMSRSVSFRSLLENIASFGSTDKSDAASIKSKFDDQHSKEFSR
jgi:hypothetical protein